MRRALVTAASFFLAATFFLAPARGEGDDRLAKAEAKQQEKIAEIFLALAKDLEAKDLKEEAGKALTRARALAPDLKGLAEAEKRVEALAGAGTADAASGKRIEKATKDAAKAYEKLAGLFEDEKEDARFARYLLAATALEPSKGRVAKIADRAKKDMLLMGSPTHPLVAWVSFPKEWKPDGEWPVLVSVEGAGCNFAGNASGFRSARGSRPWITVSPHALSCTNALEKAKFPAYDQALLTEWDPKRVEFDVAGLLALLDFLKEHFGAAEKVAITGFSGGGNLCYGMVFRHPERVLCAAPACANFNPGVASGAGNPPDGGPPVHVMTGENDPHRDKTFGQEPGIDDQTEWVMKAFADHAFTRVKHTMLPGVGHEALAKQVWEYVDEVTAKER